MKKENENIQLHIISEDYRAKKKAQNNNFSASGKAIFMSELQKEDSVIEQLKKMHANFIATKELECAVTDKGLDPIEQLGFNESINSFDLSNLFVSYEKLKKEAQGLIDCKQELPATEQLLRIRLNQEIHKKKKGIEELHGEISALQNTCREIRQELGL
jgi:hypothetical protein